MRHRTPKTWERINRLAPAIAATGVVVLSGCGATKKTPGREAQVRALYETVAADGRAHRFAAICDQDYSGLLKQLEYLFNIDCPKHLATAWAEGVQLTHVGSSTRIVITGKTATVLDGPSPDRAVFEQGRWKLLEFPRNQRHARRNEALEVAKELNRGFRKEHLPELDAETRGPGE